MLIPLPLVRSGFRDSMRTVSSCCLYDGIELVSSPLCRGGQGSVSTRLHPPEHHSNALLHIRTEHHPPMHIASHGGAGGSLSGSSTTTPQAGALAPTSTSSGLRCCSRTAPLRKGTQPRLGLPGARVLHHVGDEGSLMTPPGQVWPLRSGLTLIHLGDNDNTLPVIAVTTERGPAGS